MSLVYTIPGFTPVYPIRRAVHHPFGPAEIVTGRPLPVRLHRNITIAEFHELDTMLNVIQDIRRWVDSNKLTNGHRHWVFVPLGVLGYESPKTVGDWIYFGFLVDLMGDQVEVHDA